MLLAMMVGLPFVTAVAAAAVPQALGRLREAVATVGAGVTCLLALAIVGGFAPVLSDPQHSFVYPWVPAFGASFALGIDGISLAWVLTATALTFVVLAMPRANSNFTPATSAALLVCEGALLGISTAQDMLLLWVFWALYCLAAFCLVAARGGHRCWLVATKMGIVSFTSLALMFGVFVFVALEVQKLTGHLTFSFVVWERLVLPFRQQLWCFGALALALALSLPLLPFVGWWQGAHQESAPAGTVALLLGPSVFALIRFVLPLFPSAAHHALPLVSVVAVAGVLLSALAASQEPNFRRQIAWGAWAQTCLAVAGVASQTAQGVVGAIALSLLTSVALSALLLCLDDSASTAASPGSASAPARTKTLPTLFALSVAAMPGLGGFAAVFVLLSGVAATLRLQDHHGLPPSQVVVEPLWLAVAAAAGVVFVGVALVRSVRLIEGGPVFARWGLRGWPVFALAVALVVIGVAPQWWLRGSEATVNAYVVKHHRRVRHAMMAPESPAHFYPDDRMPWATRGDQREGAVAQKTP